MSSLLLISLVIAASTAEMVYTSAKQGAHRQPATWLGVGLIGAGLLLLLGIAAGGPGSNVSRLVWLTGPAAVFVGFRLVRITARRQQDAVSTARLRFAGLRLALEAGPPGAIAALGELRREVAGFAGHSPPHAELLADIDLCLAHHDPAPVTGVTVGPGCTE